MTSSNVTPDDILTFWRDAGPDRWYAKSAAFDDSIRDRFLGVWEKAHAGDLASWETTDEGALALILVLDQFSRNMFRDDPRAFSADRLARDVANRAIARGVDQRIDTSLRAFMYLPFEHSEDMADQERCLALFRARRCGQPEMGRTSHRHHSQVRALSSSQHRARSPDHRRGGRFPRRWRIFRLTHFRAKRIPSREENASREKSIASFHVRQKRRHGGRHPTKSLLFRVEPSRGSLPTGSLPIPGINGRVIHGS